MKQRAGLRLAVALLLLTAGMQYGRVALFIEEKPPAVSIRERDEIWVELGEGFPQPGVHQFIDEIALCGVIQVTLGAKGSARCLKILSKRPLTSGEFLFLQVEDNEIIDVNRIWMSAERRMLLAIPLQPQTMTAEDWQALPGIGPKLAKAIELYRQENGDYEALSDLARVPGIGPGRLSAWKKHFVK